jgi:hypothetical protein
MHSIEEIIANAQSAAATSLRAAYEIGREHQTVEMRDKFVAFFEGVIGPFSKSHTPAPAHEPVAEAAVEPPAEAAAEPAPAEAASETPPEAVAAEPAVEAPAEGAPAEGAPAEG